MHTQFQSRFKYQDRCQEYVKVFSETYSPTNSMANNHQSMNSTGNFGQATMRRPPSIMNDSNSFAVNTFSQVKGRDQLMVGIIELGQRTKELTDVNLAPLNLVKRKSITNKSPASPMERHKVANVSPQPDKSKLRTHDNGHTIDDLV